MIQMQPSTAVVFPLWGTVIIMEHFHMKPCQQLWYMFFFREMSSIH